ncbi:MAG: PAS domain S-box protein [Planctomycetales bacterium]|nr:PAS domain S-box protein [Planctomycetales bacterium]
MPKQQLTSPPDLQVLERRFERERAARREAEALLEQKSRELYQVNEELSQLADQFREQADRTLAIVENAAEGILTINAAGEIESFNPAAERTFGYAEHEVRGQPISLIVRCERHAETASAQLGVPICIAQSVGACREMIGASKDGAEFPIELSVSAVRLEQGQIYTALIRDLSRRKQLETQLAHAQKMESVGQLAAGIAHEINTPIQYVGDNARFLEGAFRDLDQLLVQVERLLEACRDGAPPPELVRQALEAAEAADLEYLREEAPLAIKQSIEGAERVAKIVRAMKEFSHPGVETKTAVDLNRAIESTITISHNEWKYVAELETDFDTSLPLVPCFPGDLNQAMLNLIVNAAHAIEAARQDEASPLGTIHVSTKRMDGTVEIRVADNGTGIPSDALPRVFDPFFTTKPVGKGTGQGLAITYSVVVEKHGGSIHIETAAGVGTTFIIRIPCEPAPPLP